MKISFHPLVLPVVLSRPMSGWNFPPASVTGFSTVFAPPSDPDLFFPHSIPGPSQKDNQPVSRHFPPTTLFPGRCTQRNAWYHKGVTLFRRNALYACITPGRNEALRLFCGESFYMSPQGFRSATWSPTIPLRKIAFASLCLKFPQLALQAQFPSSALINCWAVRPDTPPCRNSNWSARRSSSSSASAMPWRSASASTIS